MTCLADVSQFLASCRPDSTNKVIDVFYSDHDGYEFQINALLKPLQMYIAMKPKLLLKINTI